MTEQRSHLSANLDLLRAIAVLCVFCGHFPEANHYLTDTTWHIGQMGVLIFFVHTSLVLMQSMERLRVEGGELFKVFYIRRWFRIYPLGMFCVLAAYLFHVAPNIDHPTRYWNLKELFANLLLSQDLLAKESMVGALWSLPLEVQMYVALPVLYLLFRHRRLGWLVALWTASLPLGIWQMRMGNRLDVLPYVPCFLAGVMAWRMKQLYRPKLPGWAWLAAIAAICPIWFAASRVHHFYYRWAFCLILGLAIPWFEDIGWNWVKVPAKLVARYSYGIYLSHFAILMLFFQGLTGYSSLVRWVVFVTLMAAVPAALYHLLEAPMMAVGRHLTRREGGQELILVDRFGQRISVSRGLGHLLRHLLPLQRLSQRQ